MTQNRRRRGGFTLVEMLVVVGIIAILLAVLLPMYGGAQQRARQAQDTSNLSAIAVAMKLYRSDYSGFPLGSLSGNVDGLPDSGGNPAYTSTAYDTYDPTIARKTRVAALCPSYIEEQKELISPSEDGDTDLIDGTDPAGSFNGQDSEKVLEVGADGSASSYDDYYNVFGYLDASGGGVDLGPGSPIVLVAGQVGGGRKAQRLNNRYAPDSTIITACREHEAYMEPEAAISLVVRLGGRTDRVVRQTYSWSSQTEQAWD